MPCIFSPRKGAGAGGVDMNHPVHALPIRALVHVRIILERQHYTATHLFLLPGISEEKSQSFLSSEFPGSAYGPQKSSKYFTSDELCFFPSDFAEKTFRYVKSLRKHEASAVVYHAR